MALDVQQTSTGNYVPTTFILDVQRISAIDVNSAEFKELLVRLYQNIGLMCNVLNNKLTGIFFLEELITSGSWYPNPALTTTTPQVPTNRQEYQLVVDFGTLPAAGTKQVAHNLTMSNQYKFTRYCVTATNPAAVGMAGAKVMIPVPYAAVVPADVLEFWVDDTFINIRTGGTDYSAFSAVVILYYLKL